MNHKTAIASALAALLALAAGAAQAQDTLFQAPDNSDGQQVEQWSGQPLWRVQAYCAGVFGASNNWYADHGEKDRADESATASQRMLRAAATRLTQDRRISRSEADNLAKGVAGLAFDETMGEFDGKGLKSTTKANLHRSQCLTLQEITGA
jgi:hypothetical protein